MTLPRRYWWLLVTGLTAVLCLLATVGAGRVPGAADLADPLGRPAVLARSVVGSTAVLDDLAADIHDKHDRVAHDVAVTHRIAADLDALVAQAAHIGPLSGEATTRATALGAGFAPLPGLVGTVTGRTLRATAISTDLGADIDHVTGHLRDVGSGLTAVSGQLTTLPPLAQQIAAVLQRLERDTAPLRPLAPALSQLNPVLRTFTR